MNHQTLFKIRHLVCEYKLSRPVLKIDHLDIPKGQLVFVLGVSGVGKSTFIETLGLMNNTIRQDAATVLQFYPNAKQEGMELKDSWQQGNSQLADFRSQYFSFIFQNTNLMPNFTAGENMCISQLISNKGWDTAKKNVLQVMKYLDLPEEIFDKPTTELSGGQRQRLAFVRAITSDFAVLFGDEPTGNLDKNTAFKLMEILKLNLKNNDSTGIIVSHDIGLALEFADQIILLSLLKDENDEPLYGEAHQHDVLLKKGKEWYNYKTQLIENPEEHIYEKLIGTPKEVILS